MIREDLVLYDVLRTQDYYSTGEWWFILLLVLEKYYA